MSLTPDELTRYARHIVLREIGGPGQARLREAQVAVVGAGGLGSPVLLYLAAAGVGVIRVIDNDDVDLSNLQRQVVHATADIGRPKVHSAADRIAALNPHVTVEKMLERFAPAHVDGMDILLDGTDSFETRRAVNAACVARGVPLVSGAISQWEGQVSVFHPAGGAPCYACIFSEAPAPGQAPTCAEAGVMGALAGVVGSMMAGEAIKLIADAGRVLTGEMLIYDALWGETRRIALSRRADCPVCGVASARGADTMPG